MNDRRERRRADAAKMAVAAFATCKEPMSSAMSASATSRIHVTRVLMRSFFTLRKNDSTTAVSRQWPFRLVLGSR